MSWPWHRSPGTRELEISSPLPPEVTGEQQPTNPAGCRDRSRLGLVLETGLPRDTGRHKPEIHGLTLLLHHLDSEWCIPTYSGTPDLHLSSLIPHLLSALADTVCDFFHSYTPASSSLCLNLPLPLKAEWVQFSPCTHHYQRSQQQQRQRHPCLLDLSPHRGPTPTAPAEEPDKMKRKPTGDIQETFRENKCLIRLFFRQKSNGGFSEVYKVDKCVNFKEVSKSTSLTPTAASAWVPTLRHGSHKPL